MEFDKKAQVMLLWRLVSLILLVMILFIAFSLGSNIFAAFTGEDAQLEDSLEDLAQEINEFMSCSGNDCEANKTMIFSSPVEDIALFGMGKISRDSDFQGGFELNITDDEIRDEFIYYANGVELARPNNCALDDSCICACEEFEVDDTNIGSGNVPRNAILCDELICTQLDSQIVFKDKIFLNDVFYPFIDLATNPHINFSDIYWRNSFSVVSKNDLRISPHQIGKFHNNGTLTAGHPWRGSTDSYPNENPSFFEFTAVKTDDGELTICLEDCR